MPSHKHIFANCLNNYFVETGTFEGQGIQYALDVGFPNVKSIEIDSGYYLNAAYKYISDYRVKIYHGSSEGTLWSVIEHIKEPITFWLDGHGSGPGTPKSHQNCPLMDELEIIKKHPIKNHIILIDDIRCCGTDLFDGITKKQLEAKIFEINPEYNIEYLDSYEPKDIMCCQVHGYN